MRGENKIAHIKKNIFMHTDENGGASAKSLFGSLFCSFTGLNFGIKENTCTQATYGFFVQWWGQRYISTISGLNYIYV